MVLFPDHLRFRRGPPPGTGSPTARGRRHGAAVPRTGLATAFALLAILAGCASNDQTRRTLGVRLDDGLIQRTASRQIDAADERLKVSHVTVTSFDGIVLLTGQVENDELRQLAEDSIKDIRKIRKIHNEIRIGGGIGIFARSADSWLQTKVRTRLVAHEEIDAFRIKVVAEDDVVYLLGIVPRSQGDAAVAIARSVFGVERVVKVFEYLPEFPSDQPDQPDQTEA